MVKQPASMNSFSTSSSGLCCLPGRRSCVLMLIAAGVCQLRVSVLGMRSESDILGMLRYAKHVQLHFGRIPLRSLSAKRVIV